MRATQNVGMMPVFSGSVCAGLVIHRGPRGFEGYGPDDKSIGTFQTAQAAADALLAKEISE
jgi:hypothetical protein